MIAAPSRLELEWRVVMLPSSDADGAVASRVLAAAGMEAALCATAEELCATAEAGAAVLVLAEEALVGTGFRRVSDFLDRQPAWSDLPLIVLTARRREPRANWRTIAELSSVRNAMLLERPMRTEMLLQAVRVALRTRERQYQLRTGIAERESLLAQREMLLREVHHRVKNLLALVQALARQSEARGEAAEAYRDAFLGRLESLVQAHGLAFEASAPADLGELIGRVLAPYAADPATITIEAGPRVALARGQVTPVCLILHELATNAAKHGALSSPAGRVRVAWRDDGDAAGGDGGGRRLRLRWTEQGGPEARPPAGQGFGTRLVEFAATHELHGRAELTFAPAGLRAEIAFPLS
jgi:two-component sensor histidine kinase